MKKDAEAKAQDQEAEAKAQQREEHWLFFTQAGLACICVRPHHQKTTLGGYFRVKKDALAQARELAKTKKFKRKSGSDDKGVYCYNNSWRVHVYDSDTQNLTYGGCFKCKDEGEARAKQPATNAGIAWCKR